jgi:adenylate cyclase
MNSINHIKFKVLLDYYLINYIFFDQTINKFPSLGESGKEYLYRKTMGKEIERKFLVNGEFKHLAIRKLEIKQSYLSVDPYRVVRLRICDAKSVLTIKAPSENAKFARCEWEYEIPSAEAEEIMKICLPGRIQKTRYIVPYMDHKFEVDLFHDRHEGLIIAELELTDEEELFDRPDWLGEEVTGRPEYYNSNLIKE